MSRGDVDSQLLHQGGKPGRLPLRQLEHEPCERGCVDDRMLERVFEPAPHEPRVERVVAVLDQHRPAREPEESAARVFELGGADQHRAVDVMAASRIRVDWRAAVDQRVEERERAVELEPLGPDLEHQERGVACGLHIQGHELRLLEPRVRAKLRRIDRDLLPGDRLGSAARLEEDRPLSHLISVLAPALSVQTRSRRR